VMKWRITMSELRQCIHQEDLSQHIGLNETRLKPELTLSTILLNPFQKRIEGAGLLTSTQYSRAKSGRLECI
jgi:hypothetical protein